MIPNALVTSQAPNFLFSRIMDASYPKNFFDALREATEYVESARHNDGMSKCDALDGVEMRLSFLLEKVLAAPTATSYSVFRLD